MQILNVPESNAVLGSVPPLAVALQHLTSVVYVLMSAQGIVIAANEGFRRLCCESTDHLAEQTDTVGRDATTFFAGPSFNDISADSTVGDALLYKGLLSFFNIDKQIVSLRATIHRVGKYVEILAEHDVFENQQLINTTLSLNADLAQAQRDLARANRAQATLLAKLEEAQSRMLQREKLASIGQLAAGVAHEINNPIAYVSSNLTSLEEYMQDLWAVFDAFSNTMPLIARDPQAHNTIERICQERDIAFIREDSMALLAQSHDGLQRVKHIVQNLKNFSRVDQAQWQISNLHEGLDSTIQLMATELRTKAELVREYGDLPPIMCAPSQLNQVFMNLLVNAVQSIEKQGIITVRTGRGGIGLDPNQWGWVEVQDTGCGIAEHQMHRLFEPFYTTKMIGQGTGLGLSLCFGMVRNHGGHIEVHSEPDKGARFRIVLPLKGLPPEVASRDTLGV